MGPPQLDRGRRVPGVLSTICEIKVCPAQAAAMMAEVDALSVTPGNFNIVGGNCSTHAGQILGAGGVMSGGVSGIDTPQNLLDQLRTGYGANCYNGYTDLKSGSLNITNAGAAPPGTPPAGFNPGSY